MFAVDSVDHCWTAERLDLHSLDHVLACVLSDEAFVTMRHIGAPDSVDALESPVLLTVWMLWIHRNV
jgi:hypothetical protein